MRETSIDCSTTPVSGGYIATAISGGNVASNTLRRIQLASRKPERAHSQLAKTIPKDHLLPPIDVDVTKPETLQLAFQDAYAVISLVGVLQGSAEQFEKIQWRGAEHVAAAAKEAGARLVHFSAIGADAQSSLPYAKTKALGEQAAFRHCPDATAIRPSIVFGPGDGFFAVCSHCPSVALRSCYLPRSYSPHLAVY